MKFYDFTSNNLASEVTPTGLVVRHKLPPFHFLSFYLLVYKVRGLDPPPGPLPGLGGSCVAEAWHSAWTWQVLVWWPAPKMTSGLLCLPEIWALSRDGEAEPRFSEIVEPTAWSQLSLCGSGWSPATGGIRLRGLDWNCHLTSSSGAPEATSESWLHLALDM